MPVWYHVITTGPQRDRIRFSMPKPGIGSPRPLLPHPESIRKRQPMNKRPKCRDTEMITLHLAISIPTTPHVNRYETRPLSPSDMNATDDTGLLDIHNLTIISVHQLRSVSLDHARHKCWKPCPPTDEDGSSAHDQHEEMAQM
ncbi:hypothetical protein FRC19_003471 [Serendipita sp. 401]|nr:hypothetical protein FRC19_003471 [Serendipita sp. 401]KAG9041297.1 hypothetical protein FS842_002619 [Serendipita sp. 407]